MTLAAIGISLLALFAGVAGVGYAAATIGPNDIKKNAVLAKHIKKNAVTGKEIKKNAVTSKKVKDGSLTAADLVAEEKQIAAAFSNGGEGDCVWQNADAVIPGLGKVTYRKDRFGVVRMSGAAVPSDGIGGDGVCDASVAGQVADGIAFTLPASHMPAKSQLLGITDDITVLIVGPTGLVSGTTSLPPGAVFVTGTSSPSTLPLDGVTFDAAGSGVVLAKTKPSGQLKGSVLESLGLN